MKRLDDYVVEAVGNRTTKADSRDEERRPSKKKKKPKVVYNLPQVQMLPG